MDAALASLLSARAGAVASGLEASLLAEDAPHYRDAPAEERRVASSGSWPRSSRRSARAAPRPSSRTCARSPESAPPRATTSARSSRARCPGSAGLADRRRGRRRHGRRRAPPRPRHRHRRPRQGRAGPGIPGPQGPAEARAAQLADRLDKLFKGTDSPPQASSRSGGPGGAKPPQNKDARYRRSRIWLLLPWRRTTKPALSLAPHGAGLRSHGGTTTRPSPSFARPGASSETSRRARASQEGSRSRHAGQKRPPRVSTRSMLPAKLIRQPRSGQCSRVARWPISWSTSATARSSRRSGSGGRP